MEDFLQVGVITTTHGIRGEVKVFPTTDDANRFKELKEVYLDTGKEKLPLKVESCKFFKQFVILKFKGIDNINEIEQYKRCPLLISREEAVPLEEDEYFVADLIGLKILTETGVELGTLQNVISTGANDVYEVKLPDGGEVLLPAIKDCIMDVDMEAGEMIIRMMKGLVDE
ncbi:MAG: ribosome maturation factor RimM [Lachnospiraceae bacterium]|nr:ribosome maturation factor RimM [Lachnospiraceae bacterium]